MSRETLVDWLGKALALIEVQNDGVRGFDLHDLEIKTPFGKWTGSLELTKVEGGDPV